MNRDELIQDLYRRYLKHDKRNPQELAKICEDAHNQQEILTFLLIKNSTVISPLSKSMLSAISKDC